MRIFCSNRKVEWDDLSGSDQMAVSKANDLINYEGEGIWDAAYSACNMISEANEYCEDFDDGFCEPDFERVFSYLKSEHGVESSVSIQASSHDKAYVVTFGWDEGGPESGPIWKSGEDIVYAPSEQDACRIWEEENISDITNYEGCWARLAKLDEIEDYKKEMARQEEIDKWIEENGYFENGTMPYFEPDDFDISSSSNVSSSYNSYSDRWWSKYYSFMTDEEAADYMGVDYDEWESFGNSEDLDGYDAEHVGWLVIKEDCPYADIIADSGYDVVELCKEGGREIMGFTYGDRLNDITDEVKSIIEEAEQDQDYYEYEED